METQLKTLSSYLRSRGHRPRTVSGYVTSSRQFLKWLEKEKLDLEKAGYADLLKWIGYQQGKGMSSRAINGNLTAVRHLYASTGLDNPVSELRLRGQVHKLSAAILEMEELEKLYHSYAGAGLAGKRNRALLGVLIWQGVKRVELEQLRVEDVNLESASIRIPGTASTNSRVLDLDGRQMLGMQDYIQLVRPHLNTTSSDRLFISMGSGKKLANSLSYLMKQLRKHNAKIKSVTQLRQSRITHWLKHYDLRTVQYMSGHRYVSSTNRYQTRDLESLQERIEEVHPLNR